MRMWCDWEIFFARNMDMPVEFTQRNSIEHLMGSGGKPRSSKDARCGNPKLPMNEDERRIRKEIESGWIHYKTMKADGTMHHNAKMSSTVYYHEDGTEVTDKYENLDRYILEAAKC